MQHIFPLLRFYRKSIGLVNSTKTLVDFLWFSYPYKGIMRDIFLNSFFLLDTFQTVNRQVIDSHKTGPRRVLDT